MIKSVCVINPKGERLFMELTNPEDSGIIVERIEGLGPPNATINTVDNAYQGSIFSSSRLEQRNIVLTLAPRDKPIVEASRLKIYSAFQIGKKVTIEIQTDYRLCSATGYVESVEPDIFSDHETLNISVLCPDPCFYEQEYTETIYSKIISLFEFPFSNESLTENLLQMGEYNNEKRVSFNYKGDVDTGLTVTVHASGPYKNLIIYNVDTRERFIVNTDRIKQIVGSDILTGDDIIISTYRGDRSIKMLRNGRYTNLIGAIDKSSDWFVVTPGVNTFAFGVNEGDNNLEVRFTFRNAYGGI